MRFQAYGRFDHHRGSMKQAMTCTMMKKKVMIASHGAAHDLRIAHKSIGKLKWPRQQWRACQASAIESDFTIHVARVKDISLPAEN